MPRMHSIGGALDDYLLTPQLVVLLNFHLSTKYELDAPHAIDAGIDVGLCGVRVHAHRCAQFENPSGFRPVTLTNALVVWRSRKRPANKCALEGHDGRLV